MQFVKSNGCLHVYFLCKNVDRGDAIEFSNRRYGKSSGLFPAAWFDTGYVSYVVVIFAEEILIAIILMH